MKRAKVQVCSICGYRYVGFGHNAQPVNDGRCCSDCNWMYVVPKRMALTFKASTPIRPDPPEDPPASGQAAG